MVHETTLIILSLFLKEKKVIYFLKKDKFPYGMIPKLADKFINILQYLMYTFQKCAVFWIGRYESHASYTEILIDMEL